MSNFKLCQYIEGDTSTEFISRYSQDEWYQWGDNPASGYVAQAYPTSSSSYSTASNRALAPPTGTLEERLRAKIRCFGSEEGQITLGSQVTEHYYCLRFGPFSSKDLARYPALQSVFPHGYPCLNRHERYEPGMTILATLPIFLDNQEVDAASDYQTFVKGIAYTLGNKSPLQWFCPTFAQPLHAEDAPPVLKARKSGDRGRDIYKEPFIRPTDIVDDLLSPRNAKLIEGIYGLKQNQSQNKL
ncbi:hypothetical protein BT69DRAFT_1355859 [Atractiella rhizophila]|nr:hypothetical protein BT69DRAFT_1355859 [Atractiella rhizophila]